MNFKRASGILLHPTSLPGDFGIGDLGTASFQFIDFLADAGQTYWQILPLGPTGHGNSPYSSYSAFAGNTLLISPEKLLADGLILEDLLQAIPENGRGFVDFNKVSEWKTELLWFAFEKFQATANSPLREEFNYFSHTNRWWLDDYALYRAIKDTHGNSAWFDWAEPLKLRNENAVEAVRPQLSREISAEKFFQYIFFRQWFAVKKYANDRGIRVIGDIPIFVALDSADVWCNQAKFKLEQDGSPRVVAGVPPDYFSKTGQLWGNPIYEWDAMIADNFGWWTARIAFALETVDVVRLDHFIGFVRNWEVPVGDATAENGKWMHVPGEQLFLILHQRLGDLPIIAEDLGSMTPEVEHLRDANGFPGMRILQYGFGGDAYNRDLPHNYTPNSVAYTGTHDNDTTSGWYKSAPKNVKDHCRKYLASKSRDIHWDMIRELFASVANTAIVPAQDLLGLGSDSRMNTPGSAYGNWAWRLRPDHLDSEVAERLHNLTTMFGRTP